jgi:aspartyl-tRNA(Asn)/glutamyl-tRNA(Gln) amidotransferase subunit A
VTETDIAWMDARQLIDAYGAGTLSPVEVAEALLARIDAVDGDLDAWCLLDHDATLAEARRSEDRWRRGEPAGLVDGVPVAVKDVFLTAGWPTLRGSVNVDPAGPWEIDAPVVSALRRHGAVLLGKTTTPELGWKGVTDAPAYGVTRNPWDPARTPGGSSGGSSAALMSGTVPLALGTDGGGSIRIPAGFSGHPAIKPTWGRVPLWPVSPYGALAHAGPMARTVADNALLLQVLAEPDPRDAAALLPDGVDHRDGLDRGVEGVRVAFSPTLGYVDVHPEVAAAVRAAVELLADAGAAVEEVDPGFDDPLDAYNTLWNAGAAQATAHLSEAERARLDPGLAEITADGARYSAVEYLDAAAARGALAVRMSLFHTDHDLLVTPTLPIPAFAAGQEVPDGWPHRRWPTWTPFSYPFNLTQQPAASVPCGFAEGMPVGLQLVGARGADALVLRAAAAYEARSPYTGRRPAAYAG